MRGDYYGKLQLMQQPSATREIWRTRNDELEPSYEWSLSCLHEYNPFELFEDREFVQKLLASADLKPREMKVVNLYYVHGYTLEEIAVRLDSWTHTRERIRQIRGHALDKLKHAARLML
jgi:DNA-directed RNA polymerase specialized sigma24 family protein